MRRLTILFLAGFILFSCKNGNKNNGETSRDSLSTESKAKSETEYTCPMHPQVISKSPGNCPECGMELQVRS